MILRLSQQSILLLGLAILYLASVQYFRIVAATDPSSFFSSPERAYERRYSLARVREADEFIDNFGTKGQPVKASTRPSICVGIATVQRSSARYFRTLVGSLLQGLSSEERSDISLLPLIANTDPHVHQAFGEPWLENLTDQILTYENVSAKEKAHLRSLETPKGHREKALFDYSSMLSSCLNATDAPYLLMLEDDVLAASGWYQRLKAALKDMESRPVYDNSIYLRLFYNTRIQGWNKEAWPYYLLGSVVFEILLAVLLVLMRRSPVASRLLTPSVTSIILLVYGPACVALYFAAGRLTVHPYPNGIHQMNKYGCCSQAFAFPRHQVPPLLNYFEEKKVGLRDVLIERYADARGLTRWALTPSVFQHIGSRSTKWNGPGSEKADESGRTNTERIWNYQFEAWDSEKLRREHEME